MIKNKFIYIFIFIITIIFFNTGCEKEQTAKPTFDPPPGVYNKSLKVRIIPQNKDEVIFYEISDDFDLEKQEGIPNNPKFLRSKRLIKDDYIKVRFHDKVFIKAISGKKETKDSEIVEAIYEIRNKVERLSFSHRADKYYEPVKVRISSLTRNAVFYYTLDGSEPTINSIKYEEPIEISKIGQTVLKAIGVRKDYINSDIKEKTYNIYRELKKPTFSIEPGEYSSEISLEIISEDNDINPKIYYTLDNTTPSEKSFLYQNPIKLFNNHMYMIKAISITKPYQNSDIIQGMYTIENGKGKSFFSSNKDENISININKSYGGEGFERQKSSVITKSGFYYIAGYSDTEYIFENVSKGKNDGFVVKTDRKGNVKFQKLYGSEENDYIYGIDSTKDGGCITVGASKRKNNTTDIWVMKLNSIGEITWQKFYGGNSNDFGYSIIQTKDKGYIIVGNTESKDIDGIKNKGKEDIYVIKIDSTGNLIWNKNYGGKLVDEGFSITEYNEGYIIGGYTDSNENENINHKGQSDFYIIHVDINGKVIWEKNYGGSRIDQCYKIIKTKDNNILAVGYTESYISGLKNFGKSDFYIIKISKKGYPLWHTKFGAENEEYAYDVIETKKGYTIAGYSNSDIEKRDEKFKSDFYIVEINKNGNLKNQYKFGGNDEDIIYNIFSPQNNINEKKYYTIIGETSSSDIDGVINMGYSNYIMMSVDKKEEK